jgi:uncharacterized membrane protein YoaK (UPF0700 family)
MVSAEWGVLALLAAVAFVIAAPTEYLCYRRAWGLGARLLAWVVGATFIGVLHVLGVSSEGECSALEASGQWRGACDDFWRGYVFALPIIAGVLLALWSVLYVTAATVCRSIYRHVPTRPRASS